MAIRCTKSTCLFENNGICGQARINAAYQPLSVLTIAIGAEEKEYSGCREYRAVEGEEGGECEGECKL